MSESDRSNLGYIIPRWNTIRKQWTLLANQMPHFDWDNITAVYEARRTAQSTPEVYAAWFLDPRFRLEVANLISDNLQQVVNFLHLHTKHAATALQFELLQFHHANDIYNVPLDGVEAIRQPQYYWMTIAMRDPRCILVQPALRLFNCLANSVPSERASSHQNYIQNKVRNRLSQVKTDMLGFVYYNSRILDHSFAPTDDSTEESD